MMARIDYCDTSKSNERTREILGKNRNANIFRMMAHSASCFDELQRAALAFTDEIVKGRRPTDATFKAIAAKLTPAALVELQLSVGVYIMTSKFLETFAIDMQPVSEVI